MKRTLYTVVMLLLAAGIVNQFVPPALAVETAPSAIDRADQLYLEEYEQRAQEKYVALLARQDAKARAVVQNGEYQLWQEETYLAEYDQRAREKYLTMLAMNGNQVEWVVETMVDN